MFAGGNSWVILGKTGLDGDCGLLACKWDGFIYKGVKYSDSVERATYGRTGYLFFKVFQVSVTFFMYWKTKDVNRQ